MRLNRKNIYEINIWPGFVDILGTLLIVTIFTVLISTITQIYFNDQLQIKRGEISYLDNEVKKLLYELNEINCCQKTWDDAPFGREKEFYGIDSEAALSFFKVHEKADEIHSKVTKEALVKLCETDAQKQEALTAAATAVDALNLLLDGVYEEYCQALN